MLTMAKTLSKSKLVAYLQCPKRLWLELHRPECAMVSAASEAIFRTGHQVGEVARKVYDPVGNGRLVDLQSEGVQSALRTTAALLMERRPIFEAGFSANGGLAFSDVLLPDESATDAWRMVEVKASTSVKDYQRNDVAIQSYIARSSGLNLKSVSIAHIDSGWIYPGAGDYQGLLREEDLTAEATARQEEVRTWVVEAQAVAARESAPERTPGPHCRAPFECSFLEHCRKERPQAEFPVEWLPRIQTNALKSFIEENDAQDMREVPQELLSELQLRVRNCTVSGTVYFDAEGARQDLATHAPPAIFMDFETISFGVPIWKGTRPFQQIPFQFSVHQLSAEGVLTQCSFLDLSGDDPSRTFSERLIAACGSAGPVFVYNAGFEAARLSELEARFPDLQIELQGIRLRIVDLLPVAMRRYYHPSQQGSWSIKKVLPALVPSLSYGDLEGVSDGGMAQQAYLEAIHQETTVSRRNEISDQLIAYCKLDTLAMVRVWEVFSGRPSTVPS